MRFLQSIIIIIVLLLVHKQAFAVENPLSVPNNKYGIHILFPSELEDASRLVNGNGGEWGHITIPIQAGDKDIEKWQFFMNKAKRLRLIPIVRLSTEGDYFNTTVWRKPTDEDVLEFANFLDSLAWPTKNRYVIVFNEVNRGDEWGGIPNASEYAYILAYATDTLKKRNSDFFIISAGLDNASLNVANSSINPYDFLKAMEKAVPGIFGKIDGLASHSYPNPAFSQPPTKQDRVSVATYRHEVNLVKQLSGKSLPIFITETGWSKDAISEQRAAEFYKIAYDSVWNDPQIVAVTPFLFQAGMGSFTTFSFVKENGSPTEQYVVLQSLPKVKGQPVLSEMKIKIPASTTDNLPIKQFEEKKATQEGIVIPHSLSVMTRWLLRI